MLSVVNEHLSLSDYPPVGMGLDAAQWNQLREMKPLRSLGPIRLLDGYSKELETRILDFLVGEIA